MVGMHFTSRMRHISSVGSAEIWDMACPDRGPTSNPRVIAVNAELHSMCPCLSLLNPASGLASRGSREMLWKMASL